MPSILTGVTYPLTVGQRLPRFLFFPLIITVYLIVKKVLEREQGVSTIAEESSPTKNPKPKAYFVLGPGVTGADDCCLLVPRPPVCWPVVL